MSGEYQRLLPSCTYSDSVLLHELRCSIGSPVQVLVTSRSFSTGHLDARKQLQAAGARVVVGRPDHQVSAIGPLLADTVAWIAGTGPITAAHVAAASQLRLVARYGVGVDSVDLAAAARHGIVVTNTPGANSGAVADHAVALILAALRRIPAGDRGVRGGDWSVQRTCELGLESRVQLYASDTLSTETQAVEAASTARTPHPLLSPDLADRTIFTPHTAAHTVEAVDEMSRGATESVLAWLRGGIPANVVEPPPIPGSVDLEAPVENRAGAEPGRRPHRGRTGR